jgi:hypothetical protein
VLLLWCPPISSHYQLARQTQRGRDFGKALTSSISCCSPHRDLGASLAPVSPYKPWTGGPVGAHPWPYEFAMEPRIGTPHSLHSWAASQSRTFYTLSHGTVLPPHSLNQRDTVSPQQAVISGLWEVIRLPFCLLRQPWIQTWVLTSMKSSAPKLVPVPQWVPLCICSPRPDSLEGWIPPLHQFVCCTCGISSQWIRECTLVTREVITHHLP